MVVMFATPCLAQELETDGLFSIAGTTWRCIGVRIIRFSFLYLGSGSEPGIELYDETVSFTDRSVLTSSGNIGILQDVDTYLDFLVFSVAFHSRLGTMVLQPALGVGIFNSIIQGTMCWQGCATWPIPIGMVFGYMFKIDDDDWTP